MRNGGVLFVRSNEDLNRTEADSDLEPEFHQLVARFNPEPEAVYKKHYQERYGVWRPTEVRVPD